MIMTELKRPTESATAPKATLPIPEDLEFEEEQSGDEASWVNSH